LYFAYGANLNLDSMSFRCPGAKKVRSFYLDDWELQFSGVATIRPSPGNRVPGALWEITKECEKSLDIFEGFPTLYRKIYLQQQGHRFMVYVMNHDDPAGPGFDYAMSIGQGYRDWGLPMEELHDAIVKTQERYHDLYRCSSRNNISIGNLEKLL
jgi:gamma-glutamylcyclotransferase (GGCT)/AIG2-like uncharacterized protein YtfP